MKQAYFKYIVALILFGLNGIVASFINLSSYEIVLLRTMIGSCLLIMIFFFTKGKLTFFHYKGQFILLALSGIAMGTSWMFLYEAYQQVGVGIASLAYYCGPVIIMIFSPIIFRERLTATRVVGFLLVLLGIVLVNSKVLKTDSNTWGLFCGIMSAVMYAFMVIFNKKTKDIKGLENSMLQLFISFLTVLIFVGIKQGFIIQIYSSSLIPIFILGLLNTGIGCYLYFSSIGYLNVQTVAICGYLEPLSAVIFSVIFLNEKMLLIQIVGAIFILSGAVFGELLKQRQ